MLAQRTIRTPLMMLLMALGSTAVMADEEALKMEARQQVKAFAGDLKATLQSGMKAGGPTTALPLCNTDAPQIKAKHSQGDWLVGRTSLKVRNPNNAPDAWEQSVLQDFDKRLAAGEDPAKMEALKVEDGDVRYMKAIPAGGMCMNCHGQNLTSAVSSRLAELYPEDQAVGYMPGQIRGAFSLRKPVRF